MQPSSLVFVAIVVGWAAYLLPQWLRRRDTLSQSRGGDRHSASLRVLDRRTRVTTGPSSVPLLPDPGTVGEDPEGPAAIADRKVDAPARRPADAPRTSSVPPAMRAATVAARRLAARRRARVLTVLLTLTGVAWVASVPVPALTSVAVVISVLLGLDVAALLVSARRRAVRRAMAERVRRREIERRRAAAARRRPVTRPDAAAPEAATPSAAAEVTAAPAAPAAPERAEAPAERVARELAEGGTPWVPVPVPPPTYTLKPAAPRPEPAPLDLPPAPRPTDPAEPAAEAPAEPAARASRPWDTDRTFADDLDLDAVLARRRAVNG